MKQKFAVEVKFNWIRVGREGIPGRGNSVCKNPETWAQKKHHVYAITKKASMTGAPKGRGSMDCSFEAGHNITSHLLLKCSSII